MPDTKPKTYADLPEDVLLFLSDVDAVDQAQAFLKKYGGREEDAALLLGTGEQIVLGAKRLEDLPKILVELLGIEEGKAQAAAAEYATERLLPIAGAIGDVSGWIVKWGGKLGDLTQGQGAILPQVTADQFVEGVFDELRIAEAEPDPDSRHRLMLLLSSYVKGVRDLAETKDALVRGQKIGGMELPEDIADELLSYIDGKKKFLRVADQSPSEHRVGADGRQPLPRAPQTPPQPRVLRDIKRPAVPAPKLAQEVKPISPPPVLEKPKSVPLPTPTVASSFKKEESGADRVVEIIVQKMNLSLNEQMRKRLTTFVDARLRGVRDANQTRERLALSVLQGGMGWSGETLKVISDVLEGVVGKTQQEHQEKIVQEKQQNLQASVQKQAQKQEVDRKESQLLAQRYTTITGKAPRELTESLHAAGARTTAARSVAEHLDRQEAMVDKEKVKQAIEAVKPQPVIAAVSHSSQTILPSGRPQVQDVRVAKHLEGTVEELKRITLTDFRRLAPTPAVAVQRILDKLALLREQGPDRLVAGVEAWKHSPLHLAYVALAKEAVLSTKSLRALLSERRTTAPDELTDEELSAIITLNDQVRY